MTLICQYATARTNASRSITKRGERIWFRRGRAGRACATMYQPRGRATCWRTTFSTLYATPAPYHHHHLLLQALYRRAQTRLPLFARSWRMAIRGKRLYTIAGGLPMRYLTWAMHYSLAATCYAICPLALCCIAYIRHFFISFFARYTPRTLSCHLQTRGRFIFHFSTFSVPTWTRMPLGVSRCGRRRASASAHPALALPRCSVLRQWRTRGRRGRGKTATLRRRAANGVASRAPSCIFVIAWFRCGWAVSLRSSWRQRRYLLRRHFAWFSAFIFPALIAETNLADAFIVSLLISFAPSPAGRK